MGGLFALEELLPLFLISNAMSDQSAAEPFSATSGKDSSARVRREHRRWHELVPPCSHCLECSSPSRGTGDPGDRDPMGKRGTDISQMGVKDLSTPQLKAAPKPGGYECHFKHRDVLVSLCWQNQNLGP